MPSSTSMLTAMFLPAFLPKLAGTSDFSVIVHNLHQ